MSFLDATEALESDARMRALHELLIRAYPDKYEALSIAGQVGILQADIEVHPKMRLTWWSILDEAAKGSQYRLLRRLVANVLKDPTRAGARDALLDLLDIPEVELYQAAATPAATATGVRGTGTGVGTRAPLWAPGSTVKVRFLEGEPALHERIKEVALEWLDYVNLWLDFGDHPDAEVRVAFQPNMGTWSYIATDCLNVADPQMTINFGWLNAHTPESEVRRVALHEFGHVLGMQHEHGNPESTIEWNKEQVYKELSGPPNFWPRETVEQVIFGIWPPGYYPFHKIFDPTSIQMYAMSESWFKKGKAPGWNTELSPLDLQFVAALYPQRER